MQKIFGFSNGIYYFYFMEKPKEICMNLNWCKNGCDFSSKSKLDILSIKGVYCMRIDKPVYLIFHARNLFTNSGDFDSRFIIGYHIIEKTKYLSNISLGINGLYGSKFISI